MSLSFRRWFLENPVVGRQLATSLTGPKLGLVFSLVTGALLITGVVTLGGSLLEARSAPTANVGWNLYQANFQVVYCLLAILLPMRVSGVLDGPRLDRCFDQLVATGVSPLKLHFGNWGLGFLYALSILLVSLPFQLFSQKLGGPSWGTMTLAYGVLALYSNVIIAATLGLGIIERERVAASLSALFFFFAGRLAYSRIPSVFGEISPVRFLLRQTPN